MRIMYTTDPAFVKLITCFDRFPKKIPASSVLVVDDKKPLALLCLYFDCDVVFVHGLFKSRLCTNKEFLKAAMFLEKFVAENIVGKYAVVTFTKLRSLKKLFLKNDFKSEEITMLVKGIQ